MKASNRCEKQPVRDESLIASSSSGPGQPSTFSKDLSTPRFPTTARGSYEKVIELTDTGRQELANDLETTEDKYFITIARREYVPGLERFEKAPGRDDRLVVSFQWRWKPLNPLGERLDLRAPYSDRKEHGGRATYERNADEWKFAELWLDSDSKDYVRGLYK